MEEKSHDLLQPLIPSTKNASKIQLEDDKSINYNIQVASSNPGIIFRLVLIISIGLVSIWANHEASKGFSITIINEAGETLLGKRFALFYVSNDKASRIIFNTSKFVENFLYPNATYPKKQVNHVILRLAGQNLRTAVIVESPGDHEFVLHISPSVMEEINFSHAMFVALQQGMSRIWLWDDPGDAPSTLINGIVDYISHLAISGGQSNFGSIESPEMDSGNACWKSKNSKAVAQFLNYCELTKPGFIRRLNQALRNGWHDRMVDDALGIPAQSLCVALNSSNYPI